MSTTTTYTGVRIVDMPDLGTFTSTSSIVGERAGSGRFSATGLSGYFLPLSGGTVTGGTNFYTTDWMTPLVSWPIASGHVVALSPNGQGALVGASQSAGGGGDAIGISGYGFNNIAGTGSAAWGGYFEARQYPVATGGAGGIEVDVANVSGVDAVSATPYAIPAPASIGIHLASGAGVSRDTPALTAKTASVGLNIANNEARFLVGINIVANALVGTDGFGTGTATAIAMACGHFLQWFHSDGTAGPAIGSAHTTGASLEIVFQNNGMFIGQPAGEHFALLTTTLSLGDTVMQLRVYNNGGAQAVPVTLGAPDSGGTGYRALRVPN